MSISLLPPHVLKSHNSENDPSSLIAPNESLTKAAINPSNSVDAATDSLTGELEQELDNNSNSSRFFFSLKLSKDFVEILKLTNVIFSVVACIIFFHFQLYFNLLEYCQICYFSVLINLIDSKNRYLIFWLICSILAAITWSITSVYVESWGLPPLARAFLGIAASLYMLGSMACAYYLARRTIYYEIQIDSSTGKIKRFIELDLLIYLISLNFLCLIPKSSFDYGLHMILDIRLVLLLFTGMYRPSDKLYLLRIKTFILAIISIIVVFVMFAENFGQWLVMLFAFGVNCTLGFVFLWEAYQFTIHKKSHVMQV
eukprot:gene13704-15104_t